MCCTLFLSLGEQHVIHMITFCSYMSGITLQFISRYSYYHISSLCVPMLSYNEVKVCCIFSSNLGNLWNSQTNMDTWSFILFDKFDRYISLTTLMQQFMQQFILLHITIIVIILLICFHNLAVAGLTHTRGRRKVVALQSLLMM